MYQSAERAPPLSPVVTARGTRHGQTRFGTMHNTVPTLATLPPLSYTAKGAFARRCSGFDPLFLPRIPHWNVSRWWISIRRPSPATHAVSTFAGGAGLRRRRVIRLLGGRGAGPSALSADAWGRSCGTVWRSRMSPSSHAHRRPDARRLFVLDREKGIITEIPEHAPAYTT
jgi:hypothetical protein